MDKMIQAVLKGLGIKIPPETIAAIEALAPQIPSMVQKFLQIFDANVREFDARLKAIEQNQIKILEGLNGNRIDTRIERETRITGNGYINTGTVSGIESETH